MSHLKKFCASILSTSWGRTTTKIKKNLGHSDFCFYRTVVWQYLTKWCRKQQKIKGPGTLLIIIGISNWATKGFSELGCGNLDYAFIYALLKN